MIFKKTTDPQENVIYCMTESQSDNRTKQGAKTKEQPVGFDADLYTTLTNACVLSEKKGGAQR